MTYPLADLSVIVSKNRRVTNAGRPAGPVRSDRVRPVPVPVREKPDRLQLCRIIHDLRFTSTLSLTLKTSISFSSPLITTFALTLTLPRAF
jgi:hypothetical protein